MKKVLTFLFILLLSMSSVFAFEKFPFKARMCSDFNPMDMSGKTSFKSKNTVIFDNECLKRGSVLNVRILRIEKEKRFHRDGYFEGIVESYTFDNKLINVEDKHWTIRVKKTFDVNSTRASYMCAEYATSAITSIFLPGVDVAYYFIKGSIYNDNGPTRFKSGVHTAYENSICWIWLKGHNISLNTGDNVDVVLMKGKPIKVKKKKMTEDEEIQQALDEVDTDVDMNEPVNFTPVMPVNIMNEDNQPTMMTPPSFNNSDN